MRTKIATMWADALESGEYEQGRSVLARSFPDGRTEYCCLGVLCELAIEDEVDVPKRTAGAADGRGDDFVTQYGRDQEADLLPNEVRVWAGMQTRCGDASVMPDSLVTLNDNGTSFARIADTIRDNADAL